MGYTTANYELLLLRMTNDITFSIQGMMARHGMLF